MNSGSGSQGASGQSSSNSSGQQQSGQGSGAQGGASGQNQGQEQSNSGHQQTPQRPAYVLEAEWDAGAGKVRDDVFGKRVSDLAAFKAESDIRKNSLPSAPDKYEIKLPANFKPPEGVKFEFDMNDPALADFRKTAHARGLDQETFSDALGAYAAVKLGEQTRMAQARDAELSKLGSAAQNRIESLSTWLKARVGAKADVLVNQLQKFPHAGLVESLEEIVRQFSHQGGADFDQRGRQQQEEKGKIPNYENMSFKERRVVQMQMAGGSGR